MSLYMYYKGEPEQNDNNKVKKHLDPLFNPPNLHMGTSDKSHRGTEPRFPPPP